MEDLHHLFNGNTNDKPTKKTVKIRLKSLFYTVYYAHFTV